MKQNLYDRVDRLSSFTRYFLLFAFVLVIFAGWYALYYVPQRKRLVQSYDEIATLRKRVRMITKVDKDDKDGSRNQQSIDRDFEQLKKSFEIDDAIDYMLHQALHVGLHIDNCISQGERRKEWYLISPVLFNAQGTFDAVQEFFDVMNKSNFLVRCGSLSLIRDDNERVTLRCIMNYYHVIPDA